MTGMFHNTIELTGRDLQSAQTKARSQSEIILDYFQRFDDVWLTPFQVQKRTLPNAPITSVRRSMTDLTKAGKLRKTGIMAKEKYGALNHKWRLAGKPQQRQLF